MVNEIMVSNTNTGKNISLSSDAKNPYILDSVDWGEPDISFDDYRVPGQIGTTKLDSVVGTRTITVVGTIISSYEPEKKLGMNWNEYYKRKEESINENKKVLNNIINPFHDVMIVANDYFIIGSPSSVVKYSTDEEENNEVMCKFTFSINCFRPLFRKTTNVELEKSNKTKLFKFPMKLFENKTKFGEITASGTFLVQNNGDVDIGGTIKILANGGAILNPSVRNVTIGKTIQVTTTIQEGETLVINTYLGERDIYVLKQDGSIEDAVKDMTDSSSMFDFIIGDNLIEFSGDSQTTSFMDVTFDVDENYFNVEGQ